MKHLKIFETYLEEKTDEQKNLDYKKYINRIVVYSYKSFNGQTELFVGELLNIYFHDTFQKHAWHWVISITEYKDDKFNSFYTDFGLEDVEVLESYDTIEEALEAREIFDGTRNFNI